MRMEARKYKVIDPKCDTFGKTIKVVADDALVYTDVKTGKTYDIGQLRRIPEKHAIYFGLSGSRFGVFLFGREYLKYKSYQFGVGLDLIDSGGDRYVDVEVRLAFVGFGVRFAWIQKID